MFLKLQSGDSLDLAIVCNPRAVRKDVTYWKDGKPVDDNTPGARPSTRYLITVLDIEFGDELELQASPTLFRSIRAAAKKAHKDWLGFRFNLTRHGEGLRTRYEVKALPGDNLAVDATYLGDEIEFTNDTAEQRPIGFLSLLEPVESNATANIAINYREYRYGL